MVNFMKDKDTSNSKKKAKPGKTAEPASVADNVATSEAPDHVTAQDMYALLEVLREGLASRDKVVDLLQYEIELNQEQIAQNKEILAKRGTIYKLIFALLALGVLAVGFDQHSIIRTFEVDMNNISADMKIMKVEMTAMRKAMLSMSENISSMSTDFRHVARDVNAISHGIHGMSYDTRQMNRTMNSMSPPWK